MTIKNNLVFNSTNDYSGTFHSNSINNAYSEGSDPGLNGVDISSCVGTDIFVDYDGDDFHLVSEDDVVKNNGTSSVDSLFTDDIDGNIRTGTWDIGADEILDNITISSFATSNISATGFNTSINFINDGNSNAVTVLYYCNNTISSDCNPEMGTTAVMSRGQTIYTITASGLTTNDPGHEYNLRVITTDVDGVTGSPLNSTVTLTNYDLITPSTISDLAISYCSSDSCALTWTAPGDDGNTGTATIYDIRYSMATITEENWNSATQVIGESNPQIVGTTEAHTVAGLNANTTYYFAIKTADEFPNISELSNIATSITTLTKNYYIDYENGNDSNNGLSMATPWKHCPGDSNATGNSVSTILQAGNNVYFKKGVIYRGGEITVNGEGSIITDGETGTINVSGNLIDTNENFTINGVQAGDFIYIYGSS